MDAIVTLRWEYSPVGFLGEAISEEIGETKLNIDNGKAEATIPADVYDADPALRDSLSARIESYFRATQLLGKL